MSDSRHSSSAFYGILMLGCSLTGTSAWAATAASDGAKTQPQSAMTDKRLMVSTDGFRAERDLAAARIAIFQGNTEAAKTLVKEAQGDLKTVAQQAPKDFPNGAPTADGKGTGNTDLIPIDGQMVVADDMVLSADKAAKVKEANEHLKNGDTDKAVDTLKQGAIDVSFTRVLMPIKATDVHVDAAVNLLDQSKYYEANLALKAAQDLLQTDTVVFGDTPAQAAKMTGMPATGTPPTAGANAASAAPAKK